MKVVISDKKSGKSFQTEVEDNKSKPFYGMKIGNEFDGSLIGLTGYKVKLTGGTDKDGFPMRPDVHGTERKRLLLTHGIGFKGKRKGERKRKTVRGNIMSEFIAQMNVIVTDHGSKGISEILGIENKGEENKEESKSS